MFRRWYDEEIEVGHELVADEEVYVQPSQLQSNQGSDAKEGAT